MSKPDLVVDWCSYKAAKYAVENWHYSGVMPVGKLVKVGIWEGGVFVGCVLFGRGANNHIGSPYDLPQTTVCELVRIAMDRHKSPVSQVTKRAIAMLRSASKKMRLIVSYADPRQHHLGIVYQAMNWLYVGTTKAQRFTLGLGGKIIHKKSIHSMRRRVSEFPKSPLMWKHKYLFPLDRAMRRQIEPLAKPYPKRADVVQNGNTTGVQPENVGSIPAVRSNT